MIEWIRRRWLLLLILPFVGWAVFKAIHLYDRRADGFTFEKIHSQLPYNPDWEVATTPEATAEMKRIVGQPFTYLGKGFQCYAFESMDKQYVLKFFRHQRLRLPDFVASLPDFPLVKDYKEQKHAAFQKRMNFLFVGMKTGFQYAQHETELLYIHLNKTNNLGQTVAIFDKIGRKFVVDLDQVEFLLQRKAKLIKPTIDALMMNGDEAGAKKRLDQIFDLFVECTKKGIHDSDGALIRKDNLGFLEDRAIYIDAGKLSMRGRPQTKEGFIRDLKRLRPLEKWLSLKYPTLAEHFNAKEKEVIGAFQN